MRFFPIGRKIGNNGAKLIASLCVILTTMFALVLVFEVAFNNIAVDINLSRWLDSDFFNILVVYKSNDTILFWVSPLKH